MYRLLHSEFQKIKWPVVLVMILLEGIVTWGLASGNTKSLSYYFPYNWTTLYFQAVSFHGMFFYRFSQEFSLRSYAFMNTKTEHGSNYLHCPTHVGKYSYQSF